MAEDNASNRWKAKNKEHVQEKAREWYRSRTTSFEGYCQLFLKSIKNRQGDTDIDLDYLLSLPRACAITGKDFEYENRFKTFSNPLAPSIDQIDPGDGYKKGNVQIVLNCINKMKNDLPNEEFLKLWKELTWHAF